jgi:hypothetical protein
MGDKNLKNAHNRIVWQPPLFPKPLCNSEATRRSVRIVAMESYVTFTVAMEACLSYSTEAALRDVDVPFLILPENPRRMIQSPSGSLDGSYLGKVTGHLSIVYQFIYQFDSKKTAFLQFVKNNSE